MEGKLKQVANPHSEERMKLILKQLIDSLGSTIDEVECETDEVSCLFYGDNCSCGKTAKCRSSKCICFIRGVKCGSSCHSTTKTNCVNH